MLAMTNRENQINEFDVREILMTLWRHRVLIATITSLMFVVMAVFILTRPVYYKAAATIMIQKGEINLPDFTEVAGGEQFNNFTVQTEAKVLTSSDLALRTIEATKFGEKTGHADAAPFDLLPVFASSLTIVPQGSSKVIDVVFQAGDPMLAADMANAHIEEYQKLQIENKQAEVNKLREWFHAKVGDLKDDVVKKSQAVEAYRAQEDLAIGKGAEELFLQEISDLSTQLAPIQIRKFDVEAKIDALKTAREDGNLENIITITNSPIIINLKQQQAEAEQEVQSLRARYGSRHPKLVAASNALSQTKRSIDQEIENILQALEAEQQSVVSQESLLNDHMTETKHESDDQREKMIHLKTLIVERDASQKILDSFLANYENLQSQINFSQPDATIISRAIAPSWPSNPSKKLSLVTALLFAIAVSCTTVFVLELLRGGLRNYDDIRKLGLKPIGVMTALDDPVSVDVMNSSGHREAIKKIYVAALAGQPVRSLLFTSAWPSDVRTTMVYHLANYLVSLHKRVLVIDADFIKPMLSHLCLVADGPGLMEVVNHVVSLREAVVDTRQGFSLMRRGDMTALSPEGMASDAFDQMMRQLKEEYDYILIDSGPLLSHSESEVLAKKVDGVIVITEWMKTSRKNVANMVATLHDISAPVLGIVLNRVDLDRYKKVTAGSDFLLARPAKGGLKG